jgi:hypothetical protein
MSTPVYVLVLGKGFTEAWYQLSKAEQGGLWSKMLEADHRAGAIWRIDCTSRWADEGTLGWVVIEYPSIDAYQQAVNELEALEWWRYYSGKTILGTKREAS